ncbi:hypothetical protein [Curtobacterium sp. MCSS17_007]|uniref:hypothetical protein n=1 Tax=Curtobacterium sp. MCSS17_007 TaxID=2175646 RepID=UPI0011B3B878|nr:hypothetical protein [Curtobacterium sp. MCSS17_007]WIE76156.1 hypothetical protein DEJ22_002515 [Curtobacterium sp. MCSS17_007]
MSIGMRTVLRWVLGVPAAASITLGLIGFPLPATPGRAGLEQSEVLWESFLAQVQAWGRHDGWRFSGASWFWLSLAAAGVGLYFHLISEEEDKDRGVWRASLACALPAVAIFSVGLTGQFLLGLDWDNYSSRGGMSSEILLLPGSAVALWFFGTAFKYRRNRRRKRT